MHFCALGAGGIGKKVDVDAIPQIGGQSLLEFDLEEAAAERPWRLPGMLYIEFMFTAIMSL